jgi:hypothetical protein
MARKGNAVLRWALGLGLVGTVGLACKTNNINATTNNEADSFSVGPQAQILIGPDNVEIDVPANAVTTTIQVTLSVEATGFPALPAGEPSAGNVYSFEPAGQTFAEMLTIKIPFTASGSGTPTLLTAEDNDATWTTVASEEVSSSQGTFLTAQTNHFSWYTVVMGSGAAGEDSGPPAQDGGSDGGLSGGDSGHGGGSSGGGDGGGTSSSGSGSSSGGGLGDGGGGNPCHMPLTNCQQDAGVCTGGLVCLPSPYYCCGG